MTTTKILYAQEKSGKWEAVGIIADCVGTQRYLAKTHGVRLTEHNVERLEAGEKLGWSGDGYVDFAVRIIKSDL